jgi:hypothetical protein
MTFELFCMGIIALFVGVLICFSGYRLFLLLLPFWGFFAGFAIGAGAITGLFGDAFLATTTSWVVGFFTGLIFAVLSYLFYIIGVALLAGSFGYALGVGFMGLIGVDFGLLVWIVGIVVAVVLIVVTFRFNLAKWVIIIATGILGAEVIIGSIVLMFYPSADILANPVKAVMNASPLVAILGIVVAVLGILAQVRQSRNFTLDSYDRWSEPA